MPPRLPDVKQRVQITDGYKKPLADIRRMIGKTKGQFVQLRKTIKEVNDPKGFKGLKKSIKAVKQGVAGMSQGFQTSARRARTFIGIASLGIGGLAFSIKKLMGSFSLVEDAEASFTPLLGSVNKAKELVGALNKTAASTPFQFENLSSVALQLLPSMNGNIKETISLTRMLGDTAGGNAQRLDSVTRGYNKALIKGKVDLEGLNIIAEAGVPIFQELGKQQGLSGAKLFKAISAGKIKITDLTQTFQTMTSKGGLFYKGMEIASKTLTGQISTLRDNITLAAADAGSTLAPMLKGMVGNLTKMIQKNRPQIKKFFQELAKKIPGYIQNIIKFFKKLRDTVGPVFKFILKVINAVGWQKSAMFGFGAWIGGPFLLSLKNIIPVVTGMIGTIQGAIPVIKMMKFALFGFGGPIGWIILGVTALTAAIIIFRKELSPIWVAFKDGINPVLMEAKALFGDLKAMVVEMSGAVGQAGLAGAWSQLGGVWVQSIAWFTKLGVRMATLPLRGIISSVRAFAITMTFLLKTVKRFTQYLAKKFRPELEWLGKKWDWLGGKARAAIKPIKDLMSLARKAGELITGPKGKEIQTGGRDLVPGKKTSGAGVGRREGIGGRSLTDQISQIGDPTYAKPTLTEKVQTGGGLGKMDTAALLRATGGGNTTVTNNAKVEFDFKNMPRGVETNISGDADIDTNTGQAFGVPG